MFFGVAGACLKTLIPEMSNNWLRTKHYLGQEVNRTRQFEINSYQCRGSQVGRMTGESDGESLVASARRRFEVGDFPGAIHDFRRSVDTLPLQSVEFRMLIEMLTDRGDFAEASEFIGQKLASIQISDMDVVLELLSWRVERFRLLWRAGPGSLAFTAGLELLEDVAAFESTDLWRTALVNNWIDDVEAMAVSPHEMLSALEFQALAPADSGIPAKIVQRVEEIGHSNATDPMLAREVEVLLHALGHSSAAYRVERSKRVARETRIRPPANPKQRPVQGLSIVVAGGHPALRSLIAKSLMKEGAKTVAEIPSAKEASRVGRDVRAILTGSDVAIILVRQIAHSTSDQVRTAAAKLGIPVLTAESSGTSGVRRALQRWVST